MSYAADAQEWWEVQREANQRAGRTQDLERRLVTMTAQVHGLIGQTAKGSDVTMISELAGASTKVREMANALAGLGDEVVALMNYLADLPEERQY